MSSSPHGKSFLDELREFVAFLQSLWGILAGISVLFPLANSFRVVIPVGFIKDGGPFEFVSGPALTSISTLVALFVILATFGRRHDVRRSPTSSPLRRQAWICLAVGLFALVVYVVLTSLITEGGLYGPYREAADYQLKQLVGDLVLLCCYVGFFGLATRAFELLAIEEYFSPRR